MAELLLHDVLTDLRGLGFEDITIDLKMLEIPWIDDMEFFEEEEGE